MKGVLFLLGRFGIGGVERVTVSVANELVRRGWRVSVAAFEIHKDSLVEDLDKRIAVETLSFPAYRWRNVRRLHQILRKHKVDVVINQWALPFPVTVMLRLAMDRGVKLIAFHHTMPNRNNRIALAKGGLKALCWQKLSALNLCLVYRFSDMYVVLSESFKKVFADFTKQTDERKMRVIPNPVEVRSTSGQQKTNVILYVGRLSQSEKRVDRVVEVWRRLKDLLPDWHLEIVGDGPDRDILETAVSDLPRVKFYGFQDPVPFYERARLVLLTSDFEGFPMVLVEAMSYGCVPIAYGSFPSVCDIIQDGSGLVVQMPWNCELFVQAVLRLAKDENQRLKMSEQGMKSSRDFCMDRVIRKYEQILEG